MELKTLVWIAAVVRRRLWLTLVVLVAVLAVDGVMTWQSPRAYLARTSLLIGPSSTVDPGQLVYSVDALGRAMIVGTYADVLDTDIIRREAFQQAGVAADPRNPTIGVQATALAESAVVQVTATAPDPVTAAEIANAVGQVGQLRMHEWYPMYDLTVLTQATPPADVYRPDVRRNLGVGLLLGLLVSVSTACALDWWRSSASDHAR